MTIEQVMTQVYTTSGELTSLEFRNSELEVDPTSEGYRIMLDWINQAQIAIASWKRPQNRQYAAWKLSLVQRFRTTAEPTELEIVADQTTLAQVQISNTELSGLVGQFLVWPAVGDVRQIVEHESGILYVDRDFSRTPEVGDLLWVASNYVEVPDGEFWAGISEVVSLPDRAPLDMVRGMSYFLPEDLAIGPPTRWYRTGKRVYVDSVRAERQRLGFMVNLGPRKFEAGPGTHALELDLYEPYHYAVVIWSLVQAFGMAQEPSMKFSYTKQFEEVMMTTQIENDFQFMDESFQHSVRGN